MGLRALMGLRPLVESILTKGQEIEIEVNPLQRKKCLIYLLTV
jgi:hypothetical protein